MKSLRHIAQNILEHRSVSLNVMSGQMQRELTTEGYAEALRRCWLVPDQETGNISISHRLDAVQEMRMIAEAEPQIGEAVRVKDGAETYLGVVQAKTPDGKFKITFGGDKKPAAIRDYDASELSTDVSGQPTPTVEPTQSYSPQKPAIGTTAPVSPMMR